MDNVQILTLILQAGIDLKPKRKLFARLDGDDDGVGELEVMGLQHFILPFSFLAFGLVLSAVVFAIELSIKQRSEVAVNSDVADVDIDADVDVDICDVDDVDDIEDVDADDEDEVNVDVVDVDVVVHL